ncbi:unnamed protein product [Caenorhabditis sp. 36 PRJEB53466]|nr:unnamed protein product [Caenorhabditis sp. 36 PRJEB53466]
MVGQNSFKIETYLLDRELAIPTKRTGGGSSNIVNTFRTNFAEDQFCQKDVREHTGCVNALQFSRDQHLFASGGDDLHSRIWSVDELITRKQPKPKAVMCTPHFMNIFSLEFDLDGKHIYSGERRGRVYKHNIETNRLACAPSVSRREDDAFHLNQNPIDNEMVVVTRRHRISFLDSRDFQNPIPFQPTLGFGGDFYTAEFHPVTPRLLLVNSKKGGPNVYDVRMPIRPVYERSQFAASPPASHYAWMGSMWSPSGNQFMSIRNNAYPVYFDLISKRCFNLKSEGYLNCHTIKSMTFIDDHTVATGSDHFGIHVWKVPRAGEDEGFRRVVHPRPDAYIVPKAIKVLHGHRSIPNNMRYSTLNQILISSGVENSIKVWAGRRIPWSYDIPFVRKKAGQYLAHADEETIREKEERRLVEDALDKNGEMEGRAGWEEVFGGDPTTAEDRKTLESFDNMMRREMQLGNYNDVFGSSDSDDDDYYPLRRVIQFFDPVLAAAWDQVGSSDEDENEENEQVGEEVNNSSSDSDENDDGNDDENGAEEIDSEDENNDNSD